MNRKHTADAELMGELHHIREDQKTAHRNRLERLLADPAYTPLGVVSDPHDIHPERKAIEFNDRGGARTKVYPGDEDDVELPSADHRTRDTPWMIDAMDE